MAYLNEIQLKELGFKALGENVLISDKASIYGADKISIGSNTRIDDFCIISAGANFFIGNYVHIACRSTLIGKEKIVVQDFVDISMNCTILSSSSDPSGRYLTSPVIPMQYLNTKFALVVIKKYSVLYAHSLVLPGSIMEEGSAVGAMSLVKGTIPEYQIWGGVPAKFIRDRERGLKDLAEQIIEKNTNRYEVIYKRL
jgi:galactoside O-acetyltransferase